MRLKHPFPGEGRGPVVPSVPLTPAFAGERFDLNGTNSKGQIGSFRAG